MLESKILATIFPFPLYMYKVFIEDNIWKDTTSNRFTGFNEIRRWRIKDPLTVTVGFRFEFTCYRYLGELELFFHACLPFGIPSCFF